MTEHVNVSRSAVTLASGQPLAPGETGEPNLEDPHDKGLVDDGLLIEATGALPYKERHVEDLQAEVAKRGLTVTGTGKDGAIVKADMVSALEADDTKEKS